MVSGEQVLVYRKRYGFASAKRWKANRSYWIGSDHFGYMLINSSAMVVVERKVLVAPMILGLVLIIGVVQRDESRQVQIFAGGLMLQVMREEQRHLHQVRAHQEPLYPEDR